jgi:hypothetical protein
VRELGPDLPVTRYCLLGGVARGVALDIFTMNGSLSVDVKRLALGILLGCCGKATCLSGVIEGQGTRTCGLLVQPCLFHWSLYIYAYGLALGVDSGQ